MSWRVEWVAGESESGWWLEVEWVGRLVRVSDRVEATSSCMGIGGGGEVDGSMVVG